MHQKVPTKQGGHSKIFEGAHPRPLFITQDAAGNGAG